MPGIPGFFGNSNFVQGETAGVPDDSELGQQLRGTPSVTLQQLFSLATGQNPMQASAPPAMPTSNGGTIQPPSPPQATTSGTVVDTLNRVLQPYGLQTQEYQNAFLPNNSHPMASNLFERAMYGLALTRGGQTAGESLSNIAAGIIGVPNAMRDAREERMLHPLQTATAMQGLFSKQAEASYHAAQAQAQYANAKKEEAQAEYYNSAGRRRYWGDPFAAKDADGKYYFAQRDSTTGQAQWLLDPNNQKMEANPKSIFPGRWGDPSKKGGTSGGGSLAERMADQDDMQRDSQGLPAKTPQERENFVRNWISSQAGASQGARNDVNSGFQYTEQEKEQIRTWQSDRDAKLLKPNDSTARKEWRREYLSKGGDLSNVENAWNAHVKDVNNAAFGEFQSNLDSLRPNGRNTRPGRPMPGGSKSSGRPKVTLNTDGKIVIE